MSDSLRPQRATKLLCSWNSPGKDTGVDSHCLLQGIFSIQGLNPRLLCLLHCRQIFYHWATKESHIYVYKSFSTTLDKGMRKNIKRKRAGKIGKHKLYEMGALNIKYKKWNKLDESIKSSNCSVVFKHDCSLETSGALEEKKQDRGICIFQKIPR